LEITVRTLKSFFSRMIILVLCFAGYSLAYAQQQITVNGIPLPADTKVVPPDASVKPELARFSGAWTGVWNPGPPHILVVEQVTNEGATVIYAWGQDMSINLFNPGSRRQQATFNQQGELVLPGTTRQINYAFDGTALRGAFMSGRRSTIDLAPITLP
jgi:hypothetical protein